MVKRITVAGLVGALALALGLSWGCGPSTELTGTPIPNSLPETRVTARPPDVIEAGFVVQFFWSANDPDGRIDRYQWRISDNGTDGISVQDTLTFDPVTGDTLNPWFDTLSSDSTFLVTADIPDFPSDPPGYNRSYQTHTFWVRAIDEDGGIDPTPAMVSFTSTTLLPVMTITGPGNVVGQLEAAALPSTVAFLFDGSDPDFSSGLPTKIRYLWKRAVLPNGDYADTRNDVNQNLEYLVSFDDSLWTKWMRYDTNDESRRITLLDQPQTDNQGRNIFYLFAIQGQDTAGAVSIGRAYGYQVANVRITPSLAPVLRLLEQYLGEFRGAGTNLSRNLDVAAGQELNFSWSADASGYAGIVTSYRYGWDVSDVTDPNDPNWAVLPGNSAQHRRSPPVSFPSGVHTLTVQAEDNSQQLSRWSITLNVVPVPDPADQLPMLFIDDVTDQTSNAWPSHPAGGVRPLDRDEYRDLFWISALEGPGGVAGFSEAFNSFDTESEQVEYRDVVGYRSIVWSTRWATASTSNTNLIARTFRPTGGNQDRGDTDKYVWLTPYQQTVGNVLLAGDRVMNSFLAESAFELPIVFQSREGNPATGYVTIGTNTNVRRGFGQRTLPDGTTVEVGPLRYPYATIGIAVLDIMSPVTYYEYDTGLLIRLRRRSACAAMKGMVLDPAFKARYMPGGNVFPDTIWSDPTIDWNDPLYPPARDVLDISYVWSNAEFYDQDVIARGTQFDLQMCEEGSVRCVEAMFRSISRFDWVYGSRRLDDPNDTWPDGYYGGPGQGALDGFCGPAALNLGRTSAITNDRVVGFVARKTAPDKPSQVGDVVFGFDPYRMDNEQTLKVIRWVLGEHFGLSMNP